MESSSYFGLYQSKKILKTVQRGALLLLQEVFTCFICLLSIYTYIMIYSHRYTVHMCFFINPHLITDHVLLAYGDVYLI